jgi:hypothetical protein
MTTSCAIEAIARSSSTEEVISRSMADLQIAFHETEASTFEFATDTNPKRKKNASEELRLVVCVC